jgi:hypothetical protein
MPGDAMQKLVEAIASGDVTHTAGRAAREKRDLTAHVRNNIIGPYTAMCRVERW